MHRVPPIDRRRVSAAKADRCRRSLSVALPASLNASGNSYISVRPPAVGKLPCAISCIRYQLRQLRECRPAGAKSPGLAMRAAHMNDTRR